MNKKTKILAVLMVFTLGLLFFSLRTANKPTGTKTTREAKKTITDKTGTGTTTEKGAEQAPEQSPETAKISKEDFWTETANLAANSRMLVIPVYYHPTKRDPMQPTFTSAEAGPAFKLMIKGTSASLTGVLVGKGRAGAAIINEKIYRVGDIVDDKKIIAIEKNRVILKKGTDEEILTLKSK